MPDHMRSYLDFEKPVAELDAKVDELRALAATGSDIGEEIARLKIHANQLGVILEEGGEVGKRLDFLLQEMNREANTIGSKSSDAAIAHLIVGLKEELEKIREQLQNIE